MMKKSIALLFTAALTTASLVSAGYAAEPVKDTLINQIAESADYIVDQAMPNKLYVYSNIQDTSKSDSLPSSFDLRDQGVVPSVRYQGNFGTCWTFAAMAACEISFLSGSGLTNQEFIDLMGEEIDFSERHLAWFSSVPIQETEGMTEHELSQVGEGRVMFNDDGRTDTHFNLGGFPGYVSGMFASGMGPVPEDVVPYVANDGSTSPSSDWSVDESQRFSHALELKDSSILPSPAGRDESNNYVYNEIATDMIKKELLNGRAVTFIYFADQSMDPNAAVANLMDQMLSLGCPQEYVELAGSVARKEAEVTDFSEDDQHEVWKCVYTSVFQIPYQEITDERFADLDATYKELKAQEEASRESNDTSAGFMNTDTYAQYVWDASKLINHSAVIVGYDDNYPVSAFLPDNPPPADGAWIVRNSWGETYGNDGYFYLSYYDQSITAPETFEFVLDETSFTGSGVMISEYDFMPCSAISVGSVADPVYLANKYTIDQDSVLSYVSCMTANLDTNVTLAVYLLNADSKNPTDGRLLDVRTVDFEYAGFHRIELSQHYLLPAGSQISIVESQRFNDIEGMHYAVPYALGLNSKFIKYFNGFMKMMGGALMNDAFEGKIGHDESFIGVDDEWTDWVDFLEDAKGACKSSDDYVSFDNHSIKAYTYFLSDIEEQHSFGEALPYADGTIKMCTDCGYTLVEQ